MLEGLQVCAEEMGVGSKFKMPSELESSLMLCSGLVVRVVGLRELSWALWL
jgi:hypothetical protein